MAAQQCRNEKRQSRRASSPEVERDKCRHPEVLDPIEVQWPLPEPCTDREVGCSNGSGVTHDVNGISNDSEQGGIDIPIHHPTEHFALASDERENGMWAESNSSNTADEHWWQEVEAAIQADGYGEERFARTPLITNLLDPAGGTTRRRVSAKRPALPHEVESMPPRKRKRPG